jgi:hypothetical protein
MIRGTTAATAALGVALLTGSAAMAADVPDQDTQRAAPPAADPSAPQTSSLGIPYQIREGFFVEAQIGVFFDFGGLKGVSNAQPWTATQIGFNVPGVHRLSLFLSGGWGHNDGNCRYAAGGVCDEYSLTDNTSEGQSATDFSLIPIEVGARYGFQDLSPAVIPNLFMYITAVAGYTIFAPQIMQSAPMGAPDFGVGFGVEYGTRLEGLSFGVEILVRLAFLGAIPATASNNALGASVLPSFTAYPRFQYVF